MLRVGIALIGNYQKCECATEQINTSDLKWHRFEITGIEQCVHHKSLYTPLVFYAQGLSLTVCMRSYSLLALSLLPISLCQCIPVSLPSPFLSLSLSLSGVCTPLSVTHFLLSDLAALSFDLEVTRVDIAQPESGKQFSFRDTCESE